MGCKDLTGMRFGRLVADYRAEDLVKNGSRLVMWHCTCDCGNTKVVRAKSLMRGDTTSCGCYLREKVRRIASKHNGFGTRLYNVWDSFRQRCNNPNNKAYCNYGGRGINICEEWNDFSVFREWAFATGYKEDAKRGECTLDMVDVDGDYCPENCRWISMAEQNRNKRTTSYYELNGERRSLMDWSKTTGIKYQTLFRRYKAGWDAESVLTKRV